MNLSKIKYLISGLLWMSIAFSSCDSNEEKEKNVLSSMGTENQVQEDTMVAYPGRTFRYEQKFNDGQDKQIQVAQRIGLSIPPVNREEASKMKNRLVFIKNNSNYIIDSLTHSITYLVPAAAAELERIGEEFADILQRNCLPHYRFYVTSVLRTQEDVKKLQRSNENAISNSCHCYGTTFDLAYFRFEKAKPSREYMHQDNLKLVLGQVLLNEQRAGRIYVKYEKNQSCFHITVRE